MGVFPTLRFPGQVMLGACTSLTVTVKVHSLLRLAASVARQRTVVLPTAKVEPLKPPPMWSMPAPGQLSE